MDSDATKKETYRITDNIRMNNVVALLSSLESLGKKTKYISTIDIKLGRGPYC